MCTIDHLVPGIRNSRSSFKLIYASTHPHTRVIWCHTNMHYIHMRAPNLSINYTASACFYGNTSHLRTNLMRHVRKIKKEDYTCVFTNIPRARELYIDHQGCPFCFHFQEHEGNKLEENVYLVSSKEYI